MKVATGVHACSISIDIIALYFDSFLLKLDPKHGQPFLSSKIINCKQANFTRYLEYNNENVENFFVNSFGIKHLI